VEGRTIYEAEGEWRIAAEMGGGEWCIYEMPAREEVAAEMGEREIYEMGDERGGVVGESGGVVEKRDVVAQERVAAEAERDDASSIQEEHHFSVGRAHS
jgi:hypothetical protein